MKNERTKKEVDIVEYKADENAVWRQQFEDEIQKLNDQKRELEERQNRVKEDLDLNDVEKQQSLAEIAIEKSALQIRLSETQVEYEERQAEEYKPFIDQHMRQLHILELRFKALDNDKILNSDIIDSEALNERMGELSDAIDKYHHVASFMEDKVEEHEMNANNHYRIIDMERLQTDSSSIYAMRATKNRILEDVYSIDAYIARCDGIMVDCRDKISKMEEERALLEYDLHKTPKDDAEKRSDIMGKIEELEERYADVAGRQSKVFDISNKQWEHRSRNEDVLKQYDISMEKDRSEHTAVDIWDVQEDFNIMECIHNKKAQGSSMNSVARGMREYISQAISGIGAKLETIKDSLKDLVDKVKDVISK